MKEKPILFSGPMVRAILDWRKTQTRRRLKPQPGTRHDGTPIHFGDEGTFLKCPYGQTGDRLWVKETFRFDGIDHRFGMAERRKDELSFRADMEADRSVNDCPWRPSIFMPRWASRITLEITGVRVERLQEISEEDAKAEGCVQAFWPYERLQLGKARNYKAGYRKLWESINGPGSWDANPWVWVIEFRRVVK